MYKISFFTFGSVGRVVKVNALSYDGAIDKAIDKMNWRIAMQDIKKRKERLIALISFSDSFESDESKVFLIFEDGTKKEAKNISDLKRFNGKKPAPDNIRNISDLVRILQGIALAR